MRWWMLVGLWLGGAGWTAQPLEFVWLEGERPDEASGPVSVAKGPGGEVLSGGAWLLDTLSKEEVEAGKLGQGRRLLYRFAVRQEGVYRLWLRLGFEFVRAPLQWRLDEGEWHDIGPQMLSTNLVGLAPWCEVGWVDAGQVALKPGSHRLELLAAQPGRDGRFLLGLDAIALVQGDEKPEDKLRPNQEPDEELDRQAAAHVFRFPTSSLAQARQGQRITLSLDGPWQICRHDDPDMDQAPYEPVREPPPRPRWRGLRVPSNYHSHPALNLAHRVWYRCRVEIPQELAGRSFFLDFTGTNWIASVVVNGQFVGWHKGTRVPWQMDISSAVHPGQVNEIWVGIKDGWYAVDARFHKTTLDEQRNVPVTHFRWRRFVAPIYPSTKGDADGTEFGITDPVSLVVAGPVYVEDVFIQPSVARKEIVVEARLRNSTARALPVALQAEALFAGNGQVEKRLGPQEATVPAQGTTSVRLAAPWPNPRLWWPGADPANLYRWVSRVLLEGQVVDHQEQTFGFREITLEGPYLRINGLRFNFWNLLGGLRGSSLEEMLANFRRAGNRFERSGEDLGLRRWLGPRRKQLAWFDTHGLPVRLSTMIDGMFINYDLTNPIVWENFREHVEQVVRAYRNHPCVVVYSLENEIGFINGRLAYRRQQEQWEAELERMVQVAHRFDPTRPCMLDGTGALRGQRLEINCLHYPEASWQDYPEGAYALVFEPWVEEMGWGWDRRRPLAMGEMTFFSGRNADHAWIGGDSVYLGRYHAKRGYARFVRLLLEAYRWNDVAILCPWIGTNDFPDVWPAMSSLAAFVREQNRAFFGGSEVRRTVKVFNDTLSPAPVEFSWAVEVGGRTLAGGKRALRIEPGFGQEVLLTFRAPLVKERTEGRLRLRVSRPGESPFEDEKPLVFFPPLQRLSLRRPVFVLGQSGVLMGLLQRWGITAKAVRNLKEIGGSEAILLVAPDVLTEAQAKSEELGAYAQGGGRVVCLEQEHPWVNLGLPKPLEATSAQAGYLFPLGRYAPLLKGLQEEDFSCWAGPGSTAKRLWRIPTGAVRSWVLAGPDLAFAALLERAVGRGLIVASQLRIGAKVEVEPAAQVLLANALRYADEYEPPAVRLLAYAPQWPEMVNFVREAGLAPEEVPRLEEALQVKPPAVLLIHASSANLEALLRWQKLVKTFVEGGGWILLWGLEPGGLKAFNTLLGTQHLLREFRLERVALVRDPLTEGLGHRDVVQYSTEELLHGDKWLSQEVFTYCVDGEDIAPFCRLPGQREGPYRPTKDDHDPFNLVNGMTSHDFWRYILQIWYADWKPQEPRGNEVLLPNGSPPFIFRLPVPCRIEKVRIWNNAYYDTIKALEVRADGQRVALVELPDTNLPTEVDLKGRLVRESIELVVRSIRRRQAKPLIGLDNVEIYRQAPEWYRGRVYPLASVGGLVRYPRGKGGFVLNQVKLGPDTPENLAKKRRIVATLLLNLMAMGREESSARGRMEEGKGFQVGLERCKPTGSMGTQGPPRPEPKGA